MKIEDGTGTKKLAGVTSQNRLMVDAVNSSALESSSLNGLAYNVNTDFVTITATGESALLYIKNNEVDYNLVIDRLILNASVAAGVVAPTRALVTLYKNPDGGTIVSTATNVPIKSNRNFSSGQELEADCYVGANGLTATGGTDHLISIIFPSSRTVIELEEILGPGNSMAVSFDIDGTNPSWPLLAAVACYKDLISGS